MMTIYTQYTKHFKGPKWDSFAINEYNRKLAYRIGRRSVEQRHESFVWDTSEDNARVSGVLEFGNNNLENKSTTQRKKKGVNRNKNLPKPVVNKNKLRTRRASKIGHTSLEINKNVDKVESGHKSVGQNNNDFGQQKEQFCRRKAKNGFSWNQSKTKDGKKPFACRGSANNSSLDRQFTNERPSVKTDAKDVSLKIYF